MITCYVYDGILKVYNVKDELKAIKPKNKSFKKRWNWNEELICWELEIANNLFTKQYKATLIDFCRDNGLKLEVLESTKPPVKSIKDFDNNEDFFEYLHSQNNKNIRIN